MSSPQLLIGNLMNQKVPRLLRPGEMRQIGDEIKSPDGGWFPVCEADLGLHQTDGCYLLPVRRFEDVDWDKKLDEHEH